MSPVPRPHWKKRREGKPLWQRLVYALLYVFSLFAGGRIMPGSSSATSQFIRPLYQRIRTQEAKAARATQIVQTNLPPAPAALRAHEVSEGETLWKIAETEYGVGDKWIDIWRANRTEVANPNLIQIGQRLILPEGEMKSVLAAKEGETPAAGERLSEERHNEISYQGEFVSVALNNLKESPGLLGDVRAAVADSVSRATSALRDLSASSAVSTAVDAIVEMLDAARSAVAIASVSAAISEDAVLPTADQVASAAEVAVGAQVLSQSVASSITTNGFQALPPEVAQDTAVNAVQRAAEIVSPVLDTSEVSLLSVVQQVEDAQEAATKALQKGDVMGATQSAAEAVTGAVVAGAVFMNDASTESAMSAAVETLSALNTAAASGTTLGQSARSVGESSRVNEAFLTDPVIEVITRVVTSVMTLVTPGLSLSSANSANAPTADNLQNAIWTGVEAALQKLQADNNLPTFTSAVSTSASSAVAPAAAAATTTAVTLENSQEKKQNVDLSSWAKSIGVSNLWNRYLSSGTVASGEESFDGFVSYLKNEGYKAMADMVMTRAPGATEKAAPTVAPTPASETATVPASAAASPASQTVTASLSEEERDSLKKWANSIGVSNLWKRYEKSGTVAPGHESFEGFVAYLNGEGYKAMADMVMARAPGTEQVVAAPISRAAPIREAATPVVSVVAAAASQPITVATISEETKKELAQWTRSLGVQNLWNRYLRSGTAPEGQESFDGFVNYLRGEGYKAMADMVVARAPGTEKKEVKSTEAPKAAEAVQVTPSLQPATLGVAVTPAETISKTEAPAITEEPATITQGSIPFSTLSRGQYNRSLQERTNRVIKSEAEFSTLFGPSIPSPNFEKQMVIVVASGERNTGGYGIEVSSIFESPDTITVSILETAPGPDDMVTMAFTQPYHAVTLNKSDKAVLFEYLVTGGAEPVPGQTAQLRTPTGNLSFAALRTYSPISQGSYANQPRPGFYVFTNQADLNLFRGAVSGVTGEVDFDREIAIAVFSGQKPTGGYKLSVSAVQEFPDRIALIATESSPGRDVMVTQAFTSPYQLVKIEKTPKPIAVSLNATELRPVSDIIEGRMVANTPATAVAAIEEAKQTIDTLAAGVSAQTLEIQSQAFSEENIEKALQSIPALIEGAEAAVKSAETAGEAAPSEGGAVLVEAAKQNLDIAKGLVEEAHEANTIGDSAAAAAKISQAIETVNEAVGKAGETVEAAATTAAEAETTAAAATEAFSQIVSNQTATPSVEAPAETAQQTALVSVPVVHITNTFNPQETSKFIGALSKAIWKTTESEAVSEVQYAPITLIKGGQDAIKALTSVGRSTSNKKVADQVGKIISLLTQDKISQAEIDTLTAETAEDQQAIAEEARAGKVSFDAANQLQNVLDQNLIILENAVAKSQKKEAIITLSLGVVGMAQKARDASMGAELAPSLKGPLSEIGLELSFNGADVVAKTANPRLAALGQQVGLNIAEVETNTVVRNLVSEDEARGNFSHGAETPQGVMAKMLRNVIALYSNGEVMTELVGKLLPSELQAISLEKEGAALTIAALALHHSNAEVVEQFKSPIVQNALKQIGLSFAFNSDGSIASVSASSERAADAAIRGLVVPVSGFMSDGGGGFVTALSEGGNAFGGTPTSSNAPDTSEGAGNLPSSSESLSQNNPALAAKALELLKHPVTVAVSTFIPGASLARHAAATAIESDLLDQASRGKIAIALEGAALMDMTGAAKVSVPGGATLPPLTGNDFAPSTKAPTNTGSGGFLTGGTTIDLESAGASGGFMTQAQAGTNAATPGITTTTDQNGNVSVFVTMPAGAGIDARHEMNLVGIQLGKALSEVAKAKNVGLGSLPEVEHAEQKLQQILNSLSDPQTLFETSQVTSDLRTLADDISYLAEDIKQSIQEHHGSDSEGIGEQQPGIPDNVASLDESSSTGALIQVGENSQSGNAKQVAAPDFDVLHKTLYDAASQVIEVIQNNIDEAGKKGAPVDIAQSQLDRLKNNLDLVVTETILNEANPVGALKNELLGINEALSAAGAKAPHLPLEEFLADKVSWKSATPSSASMSDLMKGGSAKDLKAAQAAEQKQVTEVINGTMTKVLKTIEQVKAVSEQMNSITSNEVTTKSDAESAVELAFKALEAAREVYKDAQLAVALSLSSAAQNDLLNSHESIAKAEVYANAAEARLKAGDDLGAIARANSSVKKSADVVNDAYIGVSTAVNSVVENKNLIIDMSGPNTKTRSMNPTAEEETATNAVESFGDIGAADGGGGNTKSADSASDHEAIAKELAIAANAANHNPEFSDFGASGNIPTGASDMGAADLEAFGSGWEGLGATAPDSSGGEATVGNENKSSHAFGPTVWDPSMDSNSTLAGSRSLSTTPTGSWGGPGGTDKTSAEAAGLGTSNSAFTGADAANLDALGGWSGGDLGGKTDTSSAEVTFTSPHDARASDFGSSGNYSPPPPAPSFSFRGTVICTVLYQYGWMTETTWRADEAFGKSIAPETLAGYHLWAIPVARAMEKSTLIRVGVAVFALPWAHEMAHQMGARKSGSRFGRVLMKIGMPICYSLGLLLNHRAHQI